MRKWEIGIDEAGRGPLAGPVAVGVVLVPADFDWSLLPGVGDSKSVSEEKRESIYKQAKQLETAELLRCVVVMGSAKQIDKQGIAVVMRQCIAKGMKRLSARKGVLCMSPEYVMVKLDGGLNAPTEWVQQETIIKGDVKEKVIGLASIMAKVTRDRHMRRVAQRPAYAPYDLATHKGYGTKAHREAIARYGLSPEHRQTFCKKIGSVV